MYLLGYDIGSSSVKASLVDAQTGICTATDYQPRREMVISAPEAGWAEQDPGQWWEYVQAVTRSLLHKSGIDGHDIAAIGISYQMHGLVTVDAEGNVLRPAIIWCDSRAVAVGDKAFNTLGQDFCLKHLLNSPGNFTAAKLAWIRENEPGLFGKIHKIMLPGDYIAFRLTGDMRTTESGLSEGIFWDFQKQEVSQELLDVLNIPKEILADTVPTFGLQGTVTREAAKLLGLRPGTPVTYRAGDQPNNALSLNVLNPGELAATAGTSGVVYGASDRVTHDPQSRVNTFLHVNNSPENLRLGVLLCINGAGSLMSWIAKNIAHGDGSYKTLDALASEIPIGSAGVSVVPFGNGAERILCNRDEKVSIHGISFYTHDRRHLLRAAQEGIAFAFNYGMDIMRGMGMESRIIRAGHANMFLSPVFRSALAGVSGTCIEIYDTDGALGAARGAGLGAGIYATPEEAFSTLKKIMTTEPDPSDANAYAEAYERWLNHFQH